MARKIVGWTQAYWNNGAPVGMDSHSADFENSEDIAGASNVAEQSAAKKKAKKKSSASDIAFFVCFPCIIIALAVIGATVMGFIPGGMVSEICASFRAQYILVLLLCMVPAVFAPKLMRIGLMALCGIFVLVNLVVVGPCLLPKGELSGDLKSLKVLKFRVMQVNLDGDEANLDPILDEIAKLKPEVVCVTGISTPTLISLNERMPQFYLHRCQFTRLDRYGMAIYSTVDMKGNRMKIVGPEKLPIAMTSVHFDYGWFRIFLVKVPEPKDEATLKKRDQQLEAIAKVVKGMNGRKIVIGNFNMTPYTPSFSKFMEVGDLHDTRLGTGMQPNWRPDILNNVDLFVFHLPVDHMFINKSVGILSRNVCPPLGLTHRALVGDFYPADHEQYLYQEEKPDASEAEASTPAAAAKPAAATKPAADVKKGKRPKKRK